MFFQFQCTRCGTALVGDDAKAGETIVCSNADCNTENVIPTRNLKRHLPPAEQAIPLPEKLAKVRAMAKANSGPTPQEKAFGEALVVLCDMLEMLLPVIERLQEAAQVEPEPTPPDVAYETPDLQIPGDPPAPKPSRMSERQSRK